MFRHQGTCSHQGDISTVADFVPSCDIPDIPVVIPIRQSDFPAVPHVTPTRQGDNPSTVGVAPSYDIPDIPVVIPIRQSDFPANPSVSSKCLCCFLLTLLNQQRKNSGERCDTLLTTSDGTSFPAHSVILAASSSMLNAVLPPRTKTEPNVYDYNVYVGDVAASTLSNFLDLLYSGTMCCDGPAEQIENVRQLAEKLGVNKLVEAVTNIQLQMGYTGKHKQIVANPNNKNNLLSLNLKSKTIMEENNNENVSVEVTNFKIHGNVDEECQTQLLTNRATHKHQLSIQEVIQNEHNYSIHKNCPKPILPKCHTEVDKNVNESGDQLLQQSQIETIRPTAQADLIDPSYHTCDPSEPFTCIPITTEITYTETYSDTSTTYCKSNGHSNPSSRSNTTAKCKDNITTSKPEMKKFKHKKLHTAWKCIVCQENCKSKQALLKHQVSKHGEIRLPFKCDRCDKQFQLFDDLTNHKKVHKRKYHCGYCRKSAGKQHKHTVKETYKCDQCKKTFLNAISLRYHKTTHQVKKPLKCSTCTKSYATSSRLKFHSISHQKDKPFVCM